ncbi:MAG TPA: hypothetical protein VGE01_15140 [Fimbriimonas sp.]
MTLAATAGAAAYPEPYDEVQPVPLVTGQRTAVDSLSLTLKSVLEAYGRHTDYDTVACVTGNAFAPAVDKRIACGSFWHLQAPMSTKGLVTAGKVLGFSVEPVAPATDPQAPELVRKALLKGEKVIADGGWNVPEFRGTAGQITSVADDGSLTGTPAFSVSEAVVAEPIDFWILSPSTATLSSWTANHEIIHMAVDRINGNAVYQGCENCRFGVNAIDAMIERMQTVEGFCAPCQESSQNGWMCAADTLRMIDANAVISARVLRQMVKTAPAKAQRGLRRAAGYYTRISLIVKPRLKEEVLRPIMGDLERQRQFAEHVMVPIRKDLSGAGRYLQTVLDNT